MLRQVTSQLVRQAARTSTVITHHRNLHTTPPRLGLFSIGARTAWRVAMGKDADVMGTILSIALIDAGFKKHEKDSVIILLTSIFPALTKVVLRNARKETKLIFPDKDFFYSIMNQFHELSDREKFSIDVELTDEQRQTALTAARGIVGDAGLAHLSNDQIYHQCLTIISEKLLTLQTARSTPNR